VDTSASGGPCRLDERSGRGRRWSTGEQFAPAGLPPVPMIWDVTRGRNRPESLFLVAAAGGGYEARCRCNLRGRRHAGFLMLPVTHTFMMMKPHGDRQTMTYLGQGKFDRSRGSGRRLRFNWIAPTGLACRTRGLTIANVENLPANRSGAQTLKRPVRWLFSERAHPYRNPQSASVPILRAISHGGNRSTYTVNGFERHLAPPSRCDEKPIV